MKPPKNIFSSSGIREVDRLSDKQSYYIHKSGGTVVQTCLYDLNDDSLLYQEMLSYKASQASYHLVSNQEIPPDDDSDWEYLAGDYYDGGSEFSASTPSYFSDDCRSVSPFPQQRLVISSQYNPDTTDATMPITGHLDIDIPEIDLPHPDQFHFPHVSYPNASEAVPNHHQHVREVSMVTAVDPDESSLTESAFYNRPRHLLHVSQQAPNRLSISCEALPVANLSHRENESESNEESNYLTPHANSHLAKQSFARRGSEPSSPSEKLDSDDDDPVLVTRRTISGNPQLRSSWLNITSLSHSTGVVELSAPSSLRRSSSLRLKGERGDTPPLSRTVPISAVTNSQ